MRLINLSVVLSLCGLGIVQADESQDTDAAVAADASATGPAVLWSEIEQESSLMAQARAATVSLRNLIAAEGGVSVETVDVSVASAEPVEERDGYCQHLPRPGSRFMEERCFYPSKGEQAMNEYQFGEEIDQIRHQQALLFLEHAEYSLGYRRSLGQ